MTPEEGNRVRELFERLATLEGSQRDPEAAALIEQGLQYAPNAAYALVQTVLVQDEALRRAEARIRELEGGGEAPPRDTSFLGSVRDSLLGRHESRGSVPSVPAAGGSGGMSAAWRRPVTGTPAAPPEAWPAQAPGAAGGSFLGTAAAAAAGVIGGSLLLGGIRSLMGHPGGAHAAFDASPSGRDDAAMSGGGSAWGGGTGGALAHEAGVDDIGQSGFSRSMADPGLLGGTFDAPGAEELEESGFEPDEDADFGDDLSGGAADE
jgi:hypothetical protein